MLSSFDVNRKTTFVVNDIIHSHSIYFVLAANAFWSFKILGRYMCGADKTYSYMLWLTISRCEQQQEIICPTWYNHINPQVEIRLHHTPCTSVFAPGRPKTYIVNLDVFYICCRTSSTLCLRSSLFWWGLRSCAVTCVPSRHTHKHIRYIYIYIYIYIST